MTRSFLTLGLLSLATLAAALPLSRQTANHDVIVQLFQWNWESIAAECTSSIGPAGYGYVQVNPPHESITGSQWWTMYQVVSYNLDSRFGTRDQFKNMIDTCHTAGVSVIADVILNHMAGIDSGNGTAGSPFSHYNYTGTYEPWDFHYCGTTGNDIQDFGNRTQVDFCELSNLADLATETEYVRGRLAQYLNDILSLGVDGIRIDAAKHVPVADISNILGRLSRQPYITQEVYYDGTGTVLPSEYTGIGQVQAFQYAIALKSAFQSGGISTLQNLDSKGWMSSDSSNTFVANHDTERNGATLSSSSASNAYILAHIFTLATPYGKPTVFSSYSYSDPDAGGPNNNQGTCSGSGGSNGWLCQHRNPAIVGMVGFRNAVGTAPQTNWVSSNSKRIAFGRGSSGFVAINNQNSVWSGTFSTTLPAGTYCDVISGALSSGTCTGSRIVVGSNGSFTTAVSARNAVAIHVEAKL